MSIKHVLSGRGYNPQCPDCRREVDAMTPREALNLLVAAAALLQERVNRSHVAKVQQACSIWLRVNKRGKSKADATKER